MGITTERAIFKIIIPALGDTLIMLFFSFVGAVIVGFILAVIMVTTYPKGLRPNAVVYRILDFVVNILRSTPFIILMIALMPTCRIIFGTAIGIMPAIFSLIISAGALVARLLESSFREADPCLIEAAKSFGMSDARITWTVIVGESVPSIVSNLTLASVNTLSGTAMAGTVGAGGLGAVALTYGYQNFNDFIMYTTVILLIVIVMLMQYIGNRLYVKIK